MATFTSSAVESGNIETLPEYANAQSAITMNWEPRVN
jgi:hypothetical protein